MTTLFLIFIILYWEKLFEVINAIKQSYSSVLNCSGEGGFVESVRGLVFQKNNLKCGGGHNKNYSQGILRLYQKMDEGGGGVDNKMG